MIYTLIKELAQGFIYSIKGFRKQSKDDTRADWLKIVL